MPVVRELITRFGFKTDQDKLDRADASINSLVQNARRAVVVVGAIAIGAKFKQLAEDTARAGDFFDKMSLRIGVGAQALQELDFVAGLAGTSIGEFETGIRRLQKSADEAAQGVTGFQEDFARLGVSVKNSKGELKSAEELLPELGDGFAKLKSDTERVALAQSLLGRSGTALLPVLLQGTDAINAQRQEARELGIIDAELIGLSTQFIDNQLRLTKVFEGVRNILAKFMLPAMISLQEATVAVIKRNREFIGQNLGRVLGVITRVVTGVVKAFLRFADAIADTINIMTPLQRAFFGILATIAAIAALLALPAGGFILLLALLAVLIEDFEVWRSGGKSAIGDLVDSLDELLSKLGVAGAQIRGLGKIFSGVLKFIAENFRLTATFIAEALTKGPTEAFRSLVPAGLLAAKDLADTFKGVTVDIAIAKFRELTAQARAAAAGRVAAAGGVAAGGGGGPGPAIGAMQGMTRLAGQAGVVPLTREIAGQPTLVIGAPTTSTNNIDVTVNAPPGLNEQQVADMTARKIAETMQNEKRTTMQQLVPAPAG